MAVREVSFVVEGKPIAQGSKIPGRRGNGTLYVREDNDAELRPWRNAIKAAAEQNRVGWARQTEVSVKLLFMFYGTKARPFGYKPTAPDIDKLTRAVFDALQHGKLLVDDAQVVHISATKRFGNSQGVRITVRDIAGAEAKPAERNAEELEAMMRLVADGSVRVEQAMAWVRSNGV